MAHNRRLEWTVCDRCGGDLPVVDGDNDAPELPQRLRRGGDCPGAAAQGGVCGAYEGWSRGRVEQYVARRGITK